MFFVPPNGWYLDWLSSVWGALEAPALYIATDEPGKVVGDFAGYKPITAGDLKLPGFGADYYPDFYVISQADHAAISNSSYSFSACMLNEKSKTFLRPDLFMGKLAAFDPWDAEPLLHRELGILDYRTVEAALPKYLQNPNDPQLVNTIRGGRIQLADSFSQIKGEQLGLVMSMDLWTCYKLLRKANLRRVQPVAVEQQCLERVQGRLAQAQGAEAIGPYIAASLFVEPAKLRSVDLTSLSAEVQEILGT
jgi:hypothetical protein